MILNLKEKFLYFIWEQRLISKEKLITTRHNKLEIIDTGQRNINAGPDYVNAKLKIDETIWAGNIEMHLKSSDWNKHNHQTDPAYNNVILHVVLEADKEIFCLSGIKPPILVLTPDEFLLSKYQTLLSSYDKIPCGREIKKVEKFKRNLWFNRILIERLENKTEIIKHRLIENKNNWEETFYQIIARNFGFKVNEEPFEWLARSLPLNYLAKHHENLLQIEAMLFGQAGFLLEDSIDTYYLTLKKEYEHLANKFNLKPLDIFIWKFLRVRPGNFPSLRIAQFATLIYQSSNLFSKIIQIEDIDELYNLFRLNPSQYWRTHYSFKNESPQKNKYLGKKSIENIIINTIVPITFLYGKETDNQGLKDKSIAFLEQIQPENNYIIKYWNEIGIKANHAGISQSLIQLYNLYCKNKKCLECNIGNEILKLVFSENKHFNE